MGQMPPPRIRRSTATNNCLVWGLFRAIRPRSALQVRREKELANAVGTHPNILSVRAEFEDRDFIYLAQVGSSHAASSALSLRRDRPATARARRTGPSKATCSSCAAAATTARCPSR